LNGHPTGGWYPDEKMSREEALKSFTIWGAYAMFAEHIKGSLEKGKYADFIAVEGNPLENIENLKKVKLVYKGGALAVDRR
jgi:imidazolonepropionase-like amidohydrolase